MLQILMAPIHGERMEKDLLQKLSLDGRVIATEWVSGFKCSKRNWDFTMGKLYVADLNELVVIDIAGGKIEKRIAVTGAEGLNDVSVSKSRYCLCIRFKIEKDFCCKDGVSELLLDTLKGSNGVLMRGDDFYLLDAGGMFKMNKDKTLTKITDGMDGGTDGIENISGNDFIVSCWQGVVWYVNADGSKQQLLDSRADKKNSADIGMDAKNKIIYVPTFWRNTIVAYRVK